MSNTFGKIFKITTFGSSHQPFMGIVIDGCPSNIPISKKEIEEELKKRSVKSPFTTKRIEKDPFRILSGIYKEKTTGAPIAILLKNSSYNSKNYEPIKDIYRPSHSNFTYHKKYINFDPYGGGRASARETALRCIASVFAKKILQSEKIEILAFLKKIKNIETFIDTSDITLIRKKLKKSFILCPDTAKEMQMINLLKKIKKENDSIGGSVQLISSPLPYGLGEPLYDKLSSRLAYGFFSIPGVIGVSFGKNASMKGSLYNDIFECKNKKIQTKTNNHGGILAGISSGMPLNVEIIFKPTPTIGKIQESIDFQKRKRMLDMKQFPKDICIAIRGTKVVEAMASLVLADFILQKKCFL